MSSSYSVLEQPSKYINKSPITICLSNQLDENWIEVHSDCTNMKLIASELPINEKIFAYLSNLKCLIHLEVTNCMLIDINFVIDLINLQTLNLNNNKIYNATYVSGIHNLTNLTISNNYLTDVYYLNLPNLTFLDISHNKINTLDGLQCLNKLTNLNCDFNYINDLSPLTDLVNIVSLSAISNHITDISCLSNLCKLETLSLDYNVITDLSPISDCGQLTTLTCTNNRITSIMCLINLPNLTKLMCTNNKFNQVTTTIVPQSLADLHWIRKQPDLLHKFSVEIVKQYLVKSTYAIIKTQDNKKTMIDYVIIPEDYDVILQSQSIYVFDQQTYDKIGAVKLLPGTYAIKSDPYNYKIVEIAKPIHQSGWFYNQIKADEKILYTIEIVEMQIKLF